MAAIRPQCLFNYDMQHHFSPAFTILRKLSTNLLMDPTFWIGYFSQVPCTPVSKL